MPLSSRHLEYLIGAAICLISLSLSLQADEGAAPPTDLRSEYVIDSWQTEQGLPDNFINAIVQTPDGYLWVATFNGLSRFNGTQFITFDVDTTPELESSRIPRLFVDRQGRL